MKRGLLVAFLLVGCTTSSVTKPVADVSVSHVAVLPSQVPPTITREKVSAIRDQVAQQLKNSGFTVLDEKIVQKSCTPSGCAPEVALQYGIDCFVSVVVKSVARTNLLAAYYNAIQGDVSFIDPNGTAITTVSRNEGERGGLLFNSGQVLQGIQSSIANQEQQSFERLAENFAKGVVQELPKPVGSTAQNSELAQARPSIATVATKLIGQGRYSVCAEGTAQSQGTITIGRTKGVLKEIKPGSYCGIFPLSGSISEDQNVIVELRSPFGSSVQKKIEVGALKICDAATLIAVDGKTAKLQCASGDSDCEEKLHRCKGNRLLVFKGQTESGPFSFEKQLSTGGIQVEPSSVYAVLPIASDGGSSPLVTISKDHAS